MEEKRKNEKLFLENLGKENENDQNKLSLKGVESFKMFYVQNGKEKPELESVDFFSEKGLEIRAKIVNSLKDFKMEFEELQVEEKEIIEEKTDEGEVKMEGKYSRGGLYEDEDVDTF